MLLPVLRQIEQKRRLVDLANGTMTTTTCLPDGVVVGRIFKVNAAPVGKPWMWMLIFEHHEGRSPTQGYEATREAAMAAGTKKKPRSG